MEAGWSRPLRLSAAFHTTHKHTHTTHTLLFIPLFFFPNLAFPDDTTRKVCGLAEQYNATYISLLDRVVLVSACAYVWVCP